MRRPDKNAYVDEAFNIYNIFELSSYLQLQQQRARIIRKAQASVKARESSKVLNSIDGYRVSK